MSVDIRIRKGANIKFTDPITQDSIDDHDAQGIIFTFRAGATITPFSPVYIDDNDEVQEANASAIGTMPCIGVSINTADVSADADCPVLMMGVVRNDDFHNNFADGPVYVSATAGQLTTTRPAANGNIVQVVGHAIGQDLLFVQPCLTTITISA